MSAENTEESGSCCASAATSGRRSNRPGQSSLSYRLGTHSTFFERMTGLLPAQTIPDGPNAGQRPLATLTTRSTEDPAIALLDAFAVVGDVLTFYQERIANEGYLRTALERRSVLELARAVGYELRPGVAASTCLAFGVDDSPGAPGRARVDVGVKVLSVPGQDELPQTFETIEAIEARAVWNALKPRAAGTQTLDTTTGQLDLRGAALQLQPGDALLLVLEPADETGDRQTDLRTLTAVSVQTKAGYTRVTLDRPLSRPYDPARVQLFALRQRAALFGYNAPDFRLMPSDVKSQFTTTCAECPEPSTEPGDWPCFCIKTDTLRQIDLDAWYPKVIPGGYLVLIRPVLVDETGAESEEGAEAGNIIGVFRIERAQASSRTDYSLTAKTTLLTLDAAPTAFKYSLRSTLVYAQSEPLFLALEPWDERPVYGAGIELDGVVLGLTNGRKLLVSGRRMRARVEVAGLELSSVTNPDYTTMLEVGDTVFVVSPPVSTTVTVTEPTVVEKPATTWTLRDIYGFEGTLTVLDELAAFTPLAAGETDALVSELAVLTAASEEDGNSHTRLELQSALTGYYDRTTVRINGNVALATHGETTEEALGSGDGSKAHQTFTLRRSPLTYVSAPTASGAEGTLEVRANGVQWEEAASFYGLDGNSERFLVRRGEDGTTRVVFGDGREGARLPSGRENVTARYRVGLGPAGNLDAGRLTLLQTRPLGIRSVSNPLPATGGTAGESLEQARTNAPFTVLSLDRVVSRRDYEDFARSFAGVARASATIFQNTRTPLIHLTVAGPAGAEIPADAVLISNLKHGLEQARELVGTVVVASYSRVYFNLDAALVIDPAYLASRVHEAARAALTAAFDFEARDFGQPVTAAEVTAVLQAVAGVTAVDLNTLYRNVEGSGEVGALCAYLGARPARRNAGALQPAELLLLNPDPTAVKLTEKRI